MSKSVADLNRSFFESGEETESYLQRPTHQCRLREMRTIVTREIARLRTENARTRALVLDLGCSTGVSTLQACVNHDNVDLYGLDIAEEALASARKKGIKSIHRDVTDGIPFDANTFDLIMAGELLEHIVETDRLLLDIHRCLKRGGLFVLSTPNLARLIDRIRFLFGTEPKQCIPNHRYLKYHVSPFTSVSLKRTLHACGFHVERLRSTYVYLDPMLTTGAKSRALAKLMPSLGNSLIVGARRVP